MGQRTAGETRSSLGTGVFLLISNPGGTELKIYGERPLSSRHPLRSVVKSARMFHLISFFRGNKKLFEEMKSFKYMSLDDKEIND